ncbi:MAG TPA: hypothetical protein VFT62_03600, partial [Mycobacteriales bacterium]|nr:hypothetical protein [Mycobacteriales bacterium]
KDPRALRRYVRAGFDLFPQIDAAGPADASRLDRPDRPIRAGVPADRELADEVDRAVRGAARGPDHEFLALSARMYVADVGSARGYAYLTAEGRVLSVTATDDATAAALLTHCLRTDDVPTAERTIEHISGEQQWAVLIAVTAGLRLASGGPVFWRGRTPPRAHLPNGAVL